MSAPYKVWIDRGGDHEYIDCWTIEDAIAIGRAKAELTSWPVRVIGDSAEGGYGDDGSGFWDGLTDDERGILEPLGLA